MQFNKQAFLFLNGLAGKNSILDVLWVFFAQYAIFIFGLVLIYFLYRDKKFFFRLTASAVVTVILVALIKKIYSFPRPFLQEEAIRYLASDFSFLHWPVADYCGGALSAGYISRDIDRRDSCLWCFLPT